MSLVEFAVLTVYTVSSRAIVSSAHISFNMLMKFVDSHSKVYCDFPMECFHVTNQFVRMSLKVYESYFHSGFWPRQCTCTIAVHAVQCSYTCCRCQYISSWNLIRMCLQSSERRNTSVCSASLIQNLLAHENGWLRIRTFFLETLLPIKITHTLTS